MRQAAIGPGSDPRVDYILIINGPCTSDLTSVPPNVKVVQRENTCYDGGAIGEVLKGLDVTVGGVGCVVLCIVCVACWLLCA
jgi:hypothetical protein